MPTKWAEPLVAVSKPPRQKLRAEDWTRNGRKEKIIELHRSGMTCREIQAAMKEEGLDGSLASYKAHFKAWGLSHNFNEKQRRFIFKERARRGKMPVLRYLSNNEPVDPAKLRRLWSSRDRYGGIPREEILSPGGLMVVSTPSPCAASPAPMDQTEYSIELATPQTIKIDMLDAFEADVEDIPRHDVGGSRIQASNSLATDTSTVNVWQRRAQSPFTFLASDFVASLSDPEIVETVLRVLKYLNIPLDYHIQAPSATGCVISQPQSPWRKELGAFSPMTPTAVELFMRSKEVSRLLGEVNSILRLTETPWLLEPDQDSIERIHGNSKHRCTGSRKEAAGSKSAKPITRGVNMNILRDVLSGSVFLFDKDTWEEIDTADFLPIPGSAMILSEYERDILLDVKCDLVRARSLYYGWDFLDAIPVYERLLGAYYRTFGTTSVNFLDGNYELCRCVIETYLIPSELPKIEYILRQISLMYAEQLGPDHWETRRCYNLFAWALVHVGKFEQAFECLQLALNGRGLENFLEPSKLRVDVDCIARTSIHLLGRVYKYQNRFQEAMRIHEALVKYPHGHVCAQHCPDTDRFYIAIIHMRQGEFESALEIFTRLYIPNGNSTCRMGNTRLEILALQDNIAECLFRLKQPQKARLICDSVLSEAVAVRWPRYYGTAELWKIRAGAIATLAKISQGEGDLKAALRYNEQSVHIYTRILQRRNNVNVRSAISRICELLIKRGPVLYVQPLVYYYIDIQKQFNEDVSPQVAKWVRDHKNLSDDSSARGFYYA